VAARDSTSLGIFIKYMTDSENFKTGKMAEKPCLKTYSSEWEDTLALWEIERTTLADRLKAAREEAGDKNEEIKPEAEDMSATVNEDFVRTGVLAAVIYLCGGILEWNPSFSFACYCTYIVFTFSATRGPP